MSDQAADFGASRDHREARHIAANDCQAQAARARCSRLSRPTRETEAGTGSGYGTDLESAYESVTAVNQRRSSVARPTGSSRWMR